MNKNKNKNNIINCGAEANIIKIEDNILLKERIKKNYRIDILDEKLRKFRNRREFKVLKNLYDNNINVPKPLELNDKDENNISFSFEFIKGCVLKEVLTENLLKKAFEEIIKIHNSDIVHFDLTTLNMIEKNNEIYVIDFGLSRFSNKAECKAVDLNLFFSCIKNQHFELYSCKENLLKIYIKKVKNSEKILQRLKNIESRGRNKIKNI